MEIISHCVRFNLISPNRLASGEMKQIVRIKPSRNKKLKLKNLFSKKDTGGKEIVVEVGLCVIAVALLIIFRSSIASLTNTIVSEASTKIQELFDATTLK